MNFFIAILITCYLSHQHVVNAKSSEDANSPNQKITSTQHLRREQWLKKNDDDNYYNDHDTQRNIFQVPKIIGGNNVPKGKYPWFAEAQINGNWSGCAGSLVTAEFVLTAAHCIDYNFRKRGSYIIGSLCHPSVDNCGQKGEKRKVKKVFYHPDHNSWSGDNDVALVKLQSRSTIKPVRIGKSFSNLIGTRKKLWSIGYGDIDHSDGVLYPFRLQHVKLNYVNYSKCNANYKGIITKNMMCAAAKNKGTCYGDSGGPLYDLKNNFLVGVVTGGHKCGDFRFPTVYAKLSKQWRWIKRTICINHSSPLPYFC